MNYTYFFEIYNTQCKIKYVQGTRNVGNKKYQFSKDLNLSEVSALLVLRINFNLERTNNDFFWKFWYRWHITFYTKILFSKYFNISINLNPINFRKFEKGKENIVYKIMTFLF